MVYKKRHHRSKNYKKHDDSCLEDRKIDINNPTKEDMLVIKEMVKVWWNGWEDTIIIKTILETMDLIENSDKKSYEKKEITEKLLKDSYYTIANQIIGFKQNVSRGLFSCCFTLGGVFFKQWIAEEERSKKVSIKGELEVAILELYNGCIAIKDKSMYLRLEEYFPTTIDGVLKRMCNKGALVKIPLSAWREQYYEIKAVKDDLGWYLA